MPEQQALTLAELPVHCRKAVTLGDTRILIVRTEDGAGGEPTLFALEAECPHAKAPLEQGAVCNGRLVCPWHTGTFALATGALLEPPPLRDLKRYPVRLDGENIFVDPRPLAAAIPDPVARDKHLVFAGGGAATAAALCYLRDAGFAGRMTVVEPEADEPIDRTQLSKMSLSGKKPLDTLPLLSPQQDAAGPPPVYERIQAAVAHLDAADHTLTLDAAATLRYDALLLATGGRPQSPGIAGADLPHVFTIRHTRDLVRMERFLMAPTRIALIGDSFIALEAASALRQRGLHVTVLAKSRLPFAEKFGPEVAEAIAVLHRDHGVNLHTGVEVTGIGPVTVTLNTGAEIPADLVILAIGVKPVIEYASTFARSEDGGLAVGRDLRLAANIWCAGDIASVDGTRIEHWRVAEQHGRTAAEAMLAYASGSAHGPAAPCNSVPFFWTFHFGKRFGYAGRAETWESVEIEGDAAKLDFVALYLRGNTVAAALGCGRDTALAALMEPLRGSLTAEQARRAMALAAKCP